MRPCLGDMRPCRPATATGGYIRDIYTDGGYSLAASSSASPAISLPSRVTHRFPAMQLHRLQWKQTFDRDRAVLKALGGRNLQGLPRAAAYLKAEAMEAVSVPPNYQGGRKGFCISMFNVLPRIQLPPFFFFFFSCYSSIKGHSCLPGSGFLQPSSLPAFSLSNSHLLPKPEHLIYDKTHLAFPDTCLLSPF